MDDTNSRSIGKGYGFYMPIAYVFTALIIISYTVLAILYNDLWWPTLKTQFWWVFTLPALAALFWIYIFACMLKGEDDKRTKRRTMAVHEVCQRVNNQYL